MHVMPDLIPVVSEESFSHSGEPHETMVVLSYIDNTRRYFRDFSEPKTGRWPVRRLGKDLCSHAECDYQEGEMLFHDRSLFKMYYRFRGERRNIVGLQAQHPST